MYSYWRKKRMLVYVESNLFDSQAQVLVNTVNTVGVMGKGIALQFKKLYPDMFRKYQSFCDNGSLTIGKLYLYKTPNKWILNFPTKKNWRNKSKIEYIDEGLKKFVETYSEKGIESISFPQLGTGNGGLDWEKEVKPLMEKYLRKLPIKVYIHIYTGWEKEPEYKDIKSMRKWIESEPKSLSLNEFKNDFISVQDGSNFNLADRHVVISNNQDSIDETAGSFMAITNEKNGKEYSITQSDIADLWTRLRDQGAILDIDLPQNILKFKDKNFFKNLLLKLPYIGVEPAIVSGERMDMLVLKKNNLSQQNTQTINLMEG